MNSDRAVAFTSFDRAGVVSDAGTNLVFPDFGRLVARSSNHLGRGEAPDIDHLGTWAWGALLPDRSGIVVTSHEILPMSRLVRGDFRTRIWVLDFATREMRPVFEGDRPSSYMTCIDSIPDSPDWVVSAIIDGEQRLYRTDGDIYSTSLRYHQLTAEGDGFHYGADISPDGSSVVCHVTMGAKRGFPSYSIHRIDLTDGAKTVLYGDEAHLYFAPVHDPSGLRIAFLDCLHREDPGHVWADLCVAQSVHPSDISTDSPAQSTSSYTCAPNVTTGQMHWFGTSHGPAQHRGGGSNMTSWNLDGTAITCTRKLPGSHPDCKFDPSLPNHEENVFRPDLASGGTQICFLDPENGTMTDITEPVEGRWDFRVAVAPDSGELAFCRYRVGEPVEIWHGNPDGTHERKLTSGFRGSGADHPSWVPGALIDAVADAHEEE